MTEQEERKQFEEWCQKNDEFDRPNLCRRVRRHNKETYENPYIQSKWLAWMARAQLESVLV